MSSLLPGHLSRDVIIASNFVDAVWNSLVTGVKSTAIPSLSVLGIFSLP